MGGPILADWSVSGTEDAHQAPYRLRPPPAGAVRYLWAGCQARVPRPGEPGGCWELPAVSQAASCVVFTA